MLNFNRNGSFHTTSIGGIFSIVIKVLYVSYMISLLLKMINYDEDKTYTFVYSLHDENEEGMKYRDMNI